MDSEGYSVGVPQGYDEAVIRTRLALRGEGFSILSEMHVGGMLGPEAGNERQYLFMGVWNSALKEERLDSELQMASHLPCNVVVQEVGTEALVAALDPVDTVGHASDSSQVVASEARVAITRVLARVAGSTDG